MVSQGLAELRLRNSSNLVMADTFTEVHRKDGLVCAVGDAAAVSVECAGVDGLEVWETLMDGEFATPVDGRVLSLGLARDASGLVLKRQSIVDDAAAEVALTCAKAGDEVRISGATVRIVMQLHARNGARRRARRERHLVPRHRPHLVRAAATAAWRHGL